MSAEEQGTPEVGLEMRVLLVNGEPRVELHYEGGARGRSHAVHTYSAAQAREIFEAVQPFIPPPVLEQYGAGTPPTSDPKACFGDKTGHEQRNPIQRPHSSRRAAPALP